MLTPRRDGADGGHHDHGGYHDFPLHFSNLDGGGFPHEEKRAPHHGQHFRPHDGEPFTGVQLVEKRPHSPGKFLQRNNAGFVPLLLCRVTAVVNDHVGLAFLFAVLGRTIVSVHAHFLDLCH